MRRGFTLIELLVAMSIFLILTTMTIVMVNVSMDSERIGSAARQVQSFVLGAKDRASHAGEPRGVRLLRDPNNPNTVNSMLYIGGSARVSSGELLIGGPVLGDERYVQPQTTRWSSLRRQGLLPDYSPIWIGENREYNTVVYAGVIAGSDTWRLQRDHQAASDTTPLTVDKYALQVPAVVLPNQEPRLLPRGIVIDLTSSQVPPAWQSGGDMDILFNPNGMVAGPLVAFGALHLVLADVVDVEQGRTVGDLSKEGGELVVTVRPQSGLVTTGPVDLQDAGGDGIADDPFRFAALGDLP